MLGDHPEFDGIPSTGHSVPVDPNNASAGMLNVTCGGAEFVCKGGNSMSLYDSHFKRPHSAKDAGEYPYGEQDDKYSGLTGATTVSMHAFNATQLPIKKAVSEHFGVFNRYYSSTPTASTPNHLYAQSATSCGLKDNELYNACGGPTPNFPQMTIYDNLYLNNISFGIYYNSTCGDDGNQTECQQKWSGGSVYVGSPDLAMMGVARHVENFEGQETFYEQASKGTLPNFVFFTPPDEACDHPCHDMSKGERLLKDVYEALRAGPNWSKTLFLIMYDDTGGWYDHVIPPSEGVPNDGAPCNIWKGANESGCGGFDFRRLGTRSTAMVISPLIKAGRIIQEPKCSADQTVEYLLRPINMSFRSRSLPLILDLFMSNLFPGVGTILSVLVARRWANARGRSRPRLRRGLQPVVSP